MELRVICYYGVHVIGAMVIEVRVPITSSL